MGGSVFGGLLATGIGDQLGEWSVKGREVLSADVMPAQQGQPCRVAGQENETCLRLLKARSTDGVMDNARDVPTHRLRLIEMRFSIGGGSSLRIFGAPARIDAGTDCDLMPFVSCQSPKLLDEALDLHGIWPVLPAAIAFLQGNRSLPFCGQPHSSLA